MGSSAPCLTTDLLACVKMCNGNATGTKRPGSLSSQLWDFREVLYLTDHHSWNERQAWLSPWCWTTHPQSFSLFHFRVHSFHMYLSSLGPNSVSLFTLRSSRWILLAFPSSANTMGGGSLCLITVWGAHIHICRPEITDGYDISCLLIWQEIFHFPPATSWLLSSPPWTWSYKAVACKLGP